jgi:hypothetical protein
MSDIATQIIHHIQSVQTMQDIATKANLADKITELQTWQSNRLRKTYDWMLENPSHHDALEFFLTELYGPKDFRQRDQDIARVVPKMAKLLPEKAMLSLETALKLNVISYEMDFQLARNLAESQESISNDSYAEAYHASQNQDSRQLQINYLKDIGLDLAKVINMRGIGMLLKMSRKPAELAGFLVLHDMLENGYNAFVKLGKVEDFINPIVETETAIMLALFNGEKHLLPQD